MQQEMHYNEGENSCGNVIEYDSGAFWEPLQLTHRRRLDDIECSEKYKTREKSLPSERDSDERDQLPGDLVDYDELGIFPAEGPRDASGGGDADERDDDCQSYGNWGPQCWRQGICDCGPECDGSGGAPGAGSGTKVADAEEGCD